MSIPREFIELLLAKIDIVELIRGQLPLQKKSGSNYFARCPFHNEKSASFSVSHPKQFYYCFGCGAHGNAIDFIMQHDRLSFPEAIEMLARQAGMEVPHDGTAPKKDSSLPALYDLMTQACSYYYDQMRKTPRAIEYLKKRGISGEIARDFSLGYAPNGWHTLIDALGKSDTDKKKLLDVGLTIRKDEGGYYDRFRDRIMFPIHDYRGRIIGFGGRILDQGEPKYLNSPETPLFQKGHEVYGLHQALKANRKLNRVIIVEGYMDVIALFQHGITYAVATLGTATTSHHLTRLSRYTTEIIFCFDGDQAGRTAAWRAAEVMLPMMNDNLQVRFLFLPDGDDPDSLVRKEGKNTFEQRIATAMSLSDFFFQTMSRQCDLGTMEGRAQFAAAALEYINRIPAGIYQKIMLDELSKRARVEINAANQEVKSAEAVSSPVKINLPQPMFVVLGLLVQYPALALELAEPLPDLQLPGSGLLGRLLEMIKLKPHINTGGIIEYWRGQKEETIIAKLTQWDHSIPDAGIKNEFIGAFRQIKTLVMDQEINRLLAKAAQDGLSEDEKRDLTHWISKKKTLAIAT